MGQGGIRIVRLGLIGVGAWGRRYADAVARRPDDCRIVAFSRASTRSEEVLAGAVRYSAWSQMLRSAGAGDMDGVIVATTPENQAEVAEAAIQAGVPVLVEKPIGLSRETAARVWNTFQQCASRAPVLVDYIHLWSGAYRGLRSRIESHAAGTAAIASIETVGGNRGPFRGWSSLYDYGSHDLSMCLDLLGMDVPFRLHEAQRTLSGDPCGEIIDARFHLGSVPVRLRVGNGLSEKARLFAVTLKDGRRLVYDDLRPHPFKLVDAEQAVPIETTSPLDAIVGEFVAILRDGCPAGSGPRRHGLQLAVQVSLVLDEIAAAAGTAASAPISGA